jgi:hypothetical protein
VTISPAPMVPEPSRSQYERTLGPNVPGNKGPLRFEEGTATDTDVPRDFSQGANFDTAGLPGRMNRQNPAIMIKPAQQTMQERAHVGSASWIESPSVLDEFVQGAHAGDRAFPQWDRSINPGVRMQRPNATVVSD